MNVSRTTLPALSHRISTFENINRLPFLLALTRLSAEAGADIKANKPATIEPTITFCIFPFSFKLTKYPLQNSKLHDQSPFPPTTIPLHVVPNHRGKKSTGARRTGRARLAPAVAKCHETNWEYQNREQVTGRIRSSRNRLPSYTDPDQPFCRCFPANKQ